MGNMLLGLIATGCMCCTSGLAGVYFEMVLKSSDISVWIRNIHLATIGVAVSSVTVISSEVDVVRSHGFFAGYNSVVWFFILVQAGGGLLVAAVIKYTDNIMKGFAAAAGIIATSVLSMLFFNFAPRPFFFAGAFAV